MKYIKCPECETIYFCPETVEYKQLECCPGIPFVLATKDEIDDKLEEERQNGYKA